MDRRHVERILRRASARLFDEYGSPRHGNPEDPLEDLLYLMLSRKTPINKAREVFTCLRDDLGGDWAAVREKGVNYLRDRTYSLGMINQRVEDIEKALTLIVQKLGSLDLTALHGWTDDACEAFLTSLPGVGTKTARCVMLYTLGREVFPADAHCIRVLSRLGVIPMDLAKNHRRAQRELLDLVPGDISYDLHLNLVAHGQDVCTARNPSCDRCVLADMCEYEHGSVPHSSPGPQ